MIALDLVVTRTLEIHPRLGEVMLSTKHPEVSPLLVPLVCPLLLYLVFGNIHLASDTVGAGGFSGSGAATGGNAAERRALDSQTAGGNAHSGNSASTTSGSVSNVGEQDSTVMNTAMASKYLILIRCNLSDGAVRRPSSRRCHHRWCSHLGVLHWNCYWW